MILNVHYLILYIFRKPQWAKKKKKKRGRNWNYALSLLKLFFFYATNWQYQWHLTVIPTWKKYIWIICCVFLANTKTAGSGKCVVPAGRCHCTLVQSNAWDWDIFASISRQSQFVSIVGFPPAVSSGIDVKNII